MFNVLVNDLKKDQIKILTFEYYKQIFEKKPLDIFISYFINCRTERPILFKHLFYHFVR